MTNDSTSSQIRTDFNNLSKTPRKSTLILIRQFARVCMSMGNSELHALIIN